MSTGKAAAQSAHAAVEAFQLSDEDLIREWNRGGHYAKVILDAKDSTAIHTIDRYLRDRGYETAMIIDEGRTEIAPFSPTALGVEIVDKDDPEAKAIFSSFSLFKDPKPMFKLPPDEPKATIPEKNWDEQRRKGAGPWIGGKGSEPRWETDQTGDFWKEIPTSIINNVDPRTVGELLKVAGTFRDLLGDKDEKK